MRTAPTWASDSKRAACSAFVGDGCTNILLMLMTLSPQRAPTADQAPGLMIHARPVSADSNAIPKRVLPVALVSSSVICSSSSPLKILRSRDMTGIAARERVPTVGDGEPMSIITSGDLF